MKYYVEIIEFGEEKPGTVMGPFDTERHAEKVDRGANINLNHDNFYTRIREEE